MNQIEAIYRNGVFEPLCPIDLPEEQRVTLNIEPAAKETPQEWLECVSKRQAEIFQRERFLSRQHAGHRRGSTPMSDVVLDSCVVAKWFVPEVDSAQAKRLLTDTTSAGNRLVMLDLALVEVTNTIWKKHRQKRMTWSEAEGAFNGLVIAPITVEPAANLLDEAFEIAVRNDRAVYDALFVALARDLNVKGVTSDEPLYNVVHADYPEIVLLRDWP